MIECDGDGRFLGMGNGEADSSGKQQTLLVLNKITEILNAFTLTRPAMTLGEIQQATGLPTSTVQRLVSNMVSQGMLDRVGDHIRIGIRMSYWAATARKDIDVSRRRQSGAQRDPRQDHRDRMLLHRRAELPSLHRGRRDPAALRREMYVGKVIPLHVGSASRVLLAWNPGWPTSLNAPLEQLADRTVTSAGELRTLIAHTKSDGYAITAGERDDSASGLSAPVFDSAGDLLGAVTISGPTLRMPRSNARNGSTCLLATPNRSPGPSNRGSCGW